MVKWAKGPIEHTGVFLASIVLAATLVCGPVNAESETAGESQWSVVSEGPDHFEVSLTVPAPRMVEVQIGERSGSRLELAGWSSSAAEGAPMLPSKSFAVAVPEGEGYEIRVEGEDPLSFSDVLLAPFWRDAMDSEPDSIPARVASDAVYGIDEFLPRALYEARAPQYLRDLRVVPIDVHPARYNAASRELQVFGRLRITVDTRPSGGGGQRAPALVPMKRRDAGMWDGIYRSAVMNYPSEMALRALRARSQASPKSPDYFDSSPWWLAARVSSRGMYKITYEDMLASGVPKAELDSLDPATLRLFNGGGLPIDINVSVLDSPSWMTECAILVDDGGDGGFDPGDKVVFYGLGACGWSDYINGAASWGAYFENSHTDFNVYWLTWGGDFESGSALRMGSRDGQPGGDGVYAPQTYKARVHREEDYLWDPAPYEEGVRWERWWWQELSKDDPGGRVYTQDLSEVDTSAPCRLRARFWGDEFVWGTLPHHILRLEFNDSAPFLVTGQDFNRIDVDTTAVWAVEGENTFIARVPYKSDPYVTRKDKSLFAWFELEYYRRFGAVQNELAFDWFFEKGGAPTRFDAHGFSTDDVLVFDVTDRYRPVQISTSAISQGAFSFQEHFERQRANYYLVADAALRSPSEIGLRAPRSLRKSSSGPDYIVVTGKELIDPANVLANWRRTHLYGVTGGGEPAGVEVVDVADIYDEFSWGMVDPLAIRNFLELRFKAAPAGARPPSYVSILGDATWDFKDVYRSGVTNVVPAYDELYDWRSRTQYSSDDFFVLFEGAEDRYADMAVGRITEETASEAMDLITGKIIAFEKSADPGPWRDTVMLAADDACKQDRPEGEGQQHTNQVDALAKYYLPEAVDRKKIYMIDYGGPGCTSLSKPEARRDFIGALNAGAILTNYVGHGWEGGLADELLFLSDDVAALDNEGRLGLFVTASCAVGKYDVPLKVGLAEGMFRHPTKGALAAYAATTYAYITPNRELDEALVKALLPRTSTSDAVRAAPTQAIGMAVLQAETAFTLWDDYPTPYKYVLLGDPASVIAAPGTPYPREGSWMWVKAEMSAPDIAGGQRDTLSGVVMTDDGVATSFQGQADVLVQGTKLTKALAGAYAPYSYPGPTLYRGEAKVVDGRFVVSWINPYEIKTGGGGRVRAYVWNDKENAVGALTDLQISPPTGPPADTEGPKVEMSFGSSAGAVTPGSVLLITISDPSGINMAPILAENGLFLRLYNDDLDRLVDGPVDLAEGFTYEEGSSSSGTVTYRLPTGLSTEEGANAYRVVMSVSDNFSNRTSVEMVFDVVKDEGLKLADVINFPNPFSSSTTISFRVQKEADVVVRLYTVGGRLVRTFRCPGVNGWGHVEWDGRDEEGDKVANGVYLYKIKAVSTAGGREKADTVGKATVLR
jgi:hypothetical protein